MPRAATSRRTLLRAGAGVATGALLTGCSGERLRTPWSPDPSTDPQEARATPDLPLLEDARYRVAGYRDLLAATRPSGDARQLARTLDDVWATQVERLDLVLQALRGGGVQDAGAATSGAGDDAAATSVVPTELTEVGRRVREDLAAMLEGVATSTSVHRPMLLSLAAQHLASAERLGAATDWPPLVGPTGTAAVPVLARTRPAVFALEVVTARSGGEERERYEDVLAPLRSVTRTLVTLAGDAAPVPPLGYDLPEPLADAEQRLTLARAVVQDVAPAVLSVADRAGSDVAQVESLLRLVLEADLWADRLGVPEQPFPGMIQP
ncbi:hypothetical protein AVL62_09475 [Serinicoccus chungangensis]|uniref:DUF4439 domain-containing protein n=1 Tax=Serinicoccus chungangensis TaxID=767452 RepID=A0A0W8I1E0_9MICO|nr:DUF4439 domain-containing protein [Serinicoccus chungangensis]KUG51547.1 hypothetical protein AVL62_09475 [Serinicoccus chungangensis]